MVVVGKGMFKSLHTNQYVSHDCRDDIKTIQQLAYLPTAKVMPTVNNHFGPLIFPAWKSASYG